MKTITVTRSELYRKVWKKPGRILAKEYGVSDVALAKMCRRHNIPRPPRGYWAKKEAGKKVRQKRLPNQDKNPTIEIGLVASRFREAEEYSEKAPPIDPIIVRDRLVGLHPLVRRTKDYLEESDKCGRWNSPRGSHLAVSTPKSGRRRALLIMDALIRALEKRGHQVAVIMNRYDGWDTYAVIDNIKVEFEIKETTKTSHGKQITMMELLLNSHRRGAREAWRDGKVQRVEGILPDFLAALEIEAVYAREKIENEKIELENVKSERVKREEIVSRYIGEEAKISALRRNTVSWHEARRIRQYIEAVRKTTQENGKLGSCHKKEEWIKWALDQADRIDPITPSPDSILDKEPPSDWYREDRGLHSYVGWIDRLMVSENAR